MVAQMGLGRQAANFAAQALTLLSNATAVPEYS